MENHRPEDRPPCSPRRGRWATRWPATEQRRDPILIPPRSTGILRAPAFDYFPALLMGLGKVRSSVRTVKPQNMTRFSFSRTDYWRSEILAGGRSRITTSKGNPVSKVMRSGVARSPRSIAPQARVETVAVGVGQKVATGHGRGHAGGRTRVGRADIGRPWKHRGRVANRPGRASNVRDFASWPFMIIPAPSPNRANLLKTVPLVQRTIPQWKGLCQGESTISRRPYLPYPRISR